MTVSEIIIEMDEIDNIISTITDCYDKESKRVFICENTANKLMRILRNYSNMLGNKEVKE